jgi:polyhydroxybutyrate depolymerase
MTTRKRKSRGCSIEVGKMTRSYLLHLPSADDCAGSWPLVLVFHGRLGVAKGMERLTGFSDLADSEGFVVAYPQGVGRSWNAGHGAGEAALQNIDDIGFIISLIGRLVEESGADVRRVAAVGMSAGASLVHRLACEIPERISAIGAVAGTIAPSVAASCGSALPVSVLQIHGTADPIVKWDGDVPLSSARMESVDETVIGWVKRNRCSPNPEVELVNDSYMRETYLATDGTEVTLYTVLGGGHTWPSGQQYLPESMIGRTSHALDATKLAWDFFRGHFPDEDSGTR